MRLMFNGPTPFKIFSFARGVSGVERRAIEGGNPWWSRRTGAPDRCSWRCSISSSSSSGSGCSSSSSATSSAATTGWVGKALWVIFVIILPYLGVFVYLIARGQDGRAREAGRASPERSVHSSRPAGRGTTGSTADELARLADLKANGTITDAEFEQAKAKCSKTRNPERIGDAVSASVAPTGRARRT